MDYAVRLRIKSILRGYLDPKLPKHDSKRRRGKWGHQKSSKSTPSSSSFGIWQQRQPGPHLRKNAGATTLEEIQREAIEKIKLVCRRLPQAIQDIYELLLRCLKHSNFDIRLRALHIIDVLFMRSSEFRLLAFQDMHIILPSVLGTTSKPLPSPKANGLIREALEVFGRWRRNYGKLPDAGQLLRAHRYIASVLKMRFPDPNTLPRGPQGRSERRRRLQRAFLSRYVSLVKRRGAIERELPSIQRTLTELNTAFSLVIPNVADLHYPSGAQENHFSLPEFPSLFGSLDTVPPDNNQSTSSSSHAQSHEPLPSSAVPGERGLGDEEIALSGFSPFSDSGSDAERPAKTISSEELEQKEELWQGRQADLANSERDYSACEGIEKIDPVTGLPIMEGIVSLAGSSEEGNSDIAHCKLGERGGEIGHVSEAGMGFAQVKGAISSGFRTRGGAGEMDEGGIGDELEEWEAEGLDEFDDDNFAVVEEETREGHGYGEAQEDGKTGIIIRDLHSADYVEAARVLGGASRSLSIQINLGRVLSPHKNSTNHGRVKTTRSSLLPQVQPLSLTGVRETKENHVIFEAIRDLRRVVESEHLRRVRRWLRILNHVVFPRMRQEHLLRRNGVDLTGEAAKAHHKRVLEIITRLDEELGDTVNRCMY